MIAKVTMKALCSFIITLLCGVGSLSAAQQWKDTIVVARDGTGDYRTLTEAMEGETLCLQAPRARQRVIGYLL